MKKFARFAAISLSFLLVAGVAGACGDDDDSGATSATELTEIGEQLPDAIKESGVVRVGSDVEYPPIEFFKEGTEEIQGVDYDLGQALGKALGVEFKFTNDTDFANMIGSLNNGRYDIVMSAMNDTAERRGKGVDFIDYFVAGTSMIVQKGNPEKITSLDDLCGKKVAVQTGTVQDTDVLVPQMAKCEAAGKKLELLRFEKDADALQQVKLGRVVANLEDFPVAAYNAKTSGDGKDFEVVGEQIGVGKYGIAVPSTQPALRDAIQTALKAIIADGTYDKIMDKWGVAGGALKTAELNGGE